MNNKNYERTNKLISEKSPYLLHHAHNPIDWYPWSDEAFQKAQKENKPIFLSIGYSTCHWCHVMAQESFQDMDVANLLNGAFISIKVDREERPDIDSTYMRAAIALNSSGGWPLNVLLLPDKRPFFAFTYMPKDGSFARPGLKELLFEIINLWHNQPEEIIKSTESISEIVLNSQSESAFAVFEKHVVLEAFDSLAKSFDEEFGGFGSAPKFPSAHNLTFLMRYYFYSKDVFALEITEKTLREIRNGGIFDQLGYGFHRYSVDRQWHIPHFEKMIYDQATLLTTYCEAFQLTKKVFYKKTAEEIAEFCATEMLSPKGGFFSALDADSEGTEGKYYIWNYKEIQSLLKQDTEIFCEWFGIMKDGNYNDEFSGRKNGNNILRISENLKNLSKKYKISENEIEDKITHCRQILLKERSKRENPFTDDKILTDWNGLMIASLAQAGKILDRDDYIKLAEKTADFFIKSFSPDGSIYHRFREEEWAITGFLDDYVFMAHGFLNLYETTYNIYYLEQAIKLTEYTLEHFFDTKQGGFFLTSHFSNELPVRKKEYYDGAYPSGNSIAVLNLIKIAHLTGKIDYENKAEETMDSCGGLIEESPAGFTQMLQAYQHLNENPRQIVLAGNLENGELNPFLNIIKKNFLPNTSIMVKDDNNGERLKKIAPFTADIKKIDNKPTVYVCTGWACKSPIFQPDDLSALING